MPMPWSWREKSTMNRSVISNIYRPIMTWY